MATAPQTEPVRGRGELLTRPDNFRSDANMIARAVRQGWKLNPALFETIPAEATKIFAERDANGQFVEKTRTRLAAMRLITVLHAQNMADAHHAEGEQVAVSGAIELGGSVRQVHVYLPDNGRSCAPAVPAKSEKV